MALDQQLPTEIILIIASYLPESGIHALTRINRHLYNRLIKLLYYFHGQYKHGAALPFIAERDFFLQVPSILEGLSVACDQPDAPFLAAGRKRKSKEVKQMQDEDEDEEEEESVPRRRDGRWDPTDYYWQDIYTHPLYQQGKEHSIPSIVNIQHALVKAIQSGSTETVTLLLDFGAQPDFYRGNRIQCLYPQSTTKWWHAVEVDHPPLFTAVQFGNLEIVKLLLQRGADPKRYAPSPLYRAVESNRRDIIPILLEYGVGPQATALKLAVLHKEESMVKLLLDGGLKVSEYGYAALYAAGMKGDWDMVNLLKSRGATLATLSHTDRETWAKEDGDGTGRPSRHMLCISYGDVVDEESDEEEPEDED